MQEDGLYSEWYEKQARRQQSQKRYSPDQPRDPSGKFGSGSGGIIGKMGHVRLNSSAVHGQLSTLYKKAGVSFSPMAHDKTEYSFLVSKKGVVGEISSSHDANKNRVVVSSDTAALIHTHPHGDDPRPSDGDVSAAKKADIVNYALSQNAIWAANPDGTIEKVADVSSKHGEIVLSYTKGYAAAHPDMLAEAAGDSNSRLPECVLRYMRRLAEIQRR